MGPETSQSKAKKNMKFIAASRQDVERLTRALRVATGSMEHHIEHHKKRTELHDALEEITEIMGGGE